MINVPLKYPESSWSVRVKSVWCPRGPIRFSAAFHLGFGLGHHEQSKQFLAAFVYTVPPNGTIVIRCDNQLTIRSNVKRPYLAWHVSAPQLVIFRVKSAKSPTCTNHKTASVRTNC